MIIFKYIKIMINIFSGLILVLLILSFISSHNIKNAKDTNTSANPAPFSLSSKDIYYSKQDISKQNTSTNTLTRNEVINMAKQMVEVTWTPKYNLKDKYSPYIFIKGKTYHGIPYSMSMYQVSSVSDFLSNINGSKILYGNDCSGFVSTCWGIKRQTTLSLLNSVKHHDKIDGKAINQISWNDLKPGDALLFDNGKGEGHIMIYDSTDSKNSNKLNVYEQNIKTLVPFQPIPVARKDTRFKNKLIKNGYIPIRLMTLN